MIKHTFAPTDQIMSEIIDSFNGHHFPEMKDLSKELIENDGPFGDLADLHFQSLKRTLIKFRDDIREGKAINLEDYHETYETFEVYRVMNGFSELLNEYPLDDARNPINIERGCR